MEMRKFDEAAGSLPDCCFRDNPDLGIVLGSGWGTVLEMDEVLCRVSYADIEGLGATSVKGHNGEFILYRKKGKLIAAWCGRRHYYEGVGWESVVMPVEILRRMGCEKVLLTNASGGINPVLSPGDLVVIRDHINAVGLNPLIGAHHTEWGERFPDMSEVYNRRLSELLRSCQKRQGLRTMDGIYTYSAGPCYETPAEIRAYQAMGADLVGMSTVPEAVFAHACGIKVAGISLVTNLAAGISSCPLSHAEVMQSSEAAKPRMSRLIGDFIDLI